MNWQCEYASKLRSPEAAIAKFVHNGDGIYADL